MSGASETRIELERLARRWQQLPVGQALSASGALRGLAAELLDVPLTDLPDLGPATTLDQLRVAVYDHTRAQQVDPEHEGFCEPRAGHASTDVAARLAHLRRTLP